MAQLTPQQRRELLLRKPVEEIHDSYRKGYITAADRNKIVREKAAVTLEESLSDMGYLGTLYAEWIKNTKDGWENLKEAALRTPTGPASDKPLDVKNEAYYLGLAFWGQVQILTSAFKAVGEVTGKVAEMQALRLGASPGLARTVGIAVDVGTGFVPVGGVAQGFAKGVQGIGAASKARTAARVLSAQEKASAAVSNAAKAIEEGLRVESPAAATAFAAQEKIRAVARTADPLGKEAIAQIKNTGKTLAEGQARPAAERAAQEAAIQGEKAIREAEASIAKDTPPTVAEKVAEYLRTFQDELKGMTEVQTHAMTAKMADKLGLSLEDLRTIVPGQALNEREMYAYLKALKPLTEENTRLARLAVSEGTEDAMHAYLLHQSELFTLMPKFRGAEVTAGRSVEILKEEPAVKQLTNMAMAWDPEAVAKSKTLLGPGMTMAEDWLAMVDDAPQKAEALVAVANSHWHQFKEQGWPMIREGYLNLLLARPLTHVKNLIGNSLASTTAIAERFAGGVLSIDREKGILASEGFALSKGMMLSIGDGLKAFAKAFERMSPEEASKFDFMTGKIPGVLGSIIRTPGNALQGMDNLFKTMLRRGSYGAQALREGSQKGYVGDDLADYIARRMNNPTQKMMTEAQDFALYQTFQNDLGTLGAKAQGLLQYGPMVLYFPFMKTPMNLAKYTFNRTPGLQLMAKSLYTDILAGGTKADLAIGRLTISNMTAFFFSELAKDGLITGSGPVDAAFRRGWLNTHEPYSAKGKDGWVSLGGMEPATTQMALVADFTQVLNQLDEPTAGQGAMALLYAGVNDIMDKTYFQTVGDLLDITGGVALGHTPGKSRMNVLTGPITAAVTGGPVVSAVARIIDPVKRQARTFFDGILARMPGYSKTVPPTRDSYGDPIMYPQAVGSAWLNLVSPYTIKPYTEDRVKKEGDRLKISVPKFPDSMGGNVPDDFDIKAPMPTDMLPVGLTGAEKDRWQELYRLNLRHPKNGIEPNLLDVPEYQAAPKMQQRQWFLNFMATTRKTAGDALQVEDAELGKKVLTNRAKTVLPLLNEPERSQAEQAITEAVTLFDRLAPQERENLLRWGVLDEPEETP